MAPLSDEKVLAPRGNEHLSGHRLKNFAAASAIPAGSFSYPK